MRNSEEPVDLNSIGGIGSERTEGMADRAMHGGNIAGPNPPGEDSGRGVDAPDMATGGTPGSLTDPDDTYRAFGKGEEGGEDVGEDGDVQSGHDASLDNP